jgi:hypothetical protein
MSRLVKTNSFASTTSAVSTAIKGQRKNTNLLMEIEMQRLVICHELEKKLEAFQRGDIFEYIYTCIRIYVYMSARIYVRI